MPFAYRNPTIQYLDRPPLRENPIAIGLIRLSGVHLPGPTVLQYPRFRMELHDTVLPPYKLWGSVAELTCHLQGSTPYGVKFSPKTYRPSPTKDVTWKDPPLIRGPLIGGYTVLQCSRFRMELHDTCRGQNAARSYIKALILMVIP
jgi:hypothetical protein